MFIPTLGQIDSLILKLERAVKQNIAAVDMGHSMPATDRDWPECEDRSNAIYGNSCTMCGLRFYGFKRRLVCHPCYTEGMKRKPAEPVPLSSLKAGDWIEWKGGEQPLPDGTLVIVRHGDGWEGEAIVGEACGYDTHWTHDCWECNKIIAYRLVNP